jgi:glycine cleavage system transcriptional repressor
MESPSQESVLMLTVTGPDRPGIIAAISGVLAAEGVDIEDVSMTRLSGNFAMMLMARGATPEVIGRKLEAAASGVGVKIHLEPCAAPAETPEEANIFVSAAGPNRVGIVAALSHLLASHGANIHEMTTRLLHKTRVPVYLVRIEAHYDGDWATLQQALADAGRTMGVEVRLDPLERADL